LIERKLVAERNERGSHLGSLNACDASNGEHVSLGKSLILQCLDGGFCTAKASVSCGFTSLYRLLCDIHHVGFATFIEMRKGALHGLIYG
jgi:hypothetical protein